ncbi:mitochondrial intermediate peptidase [Wickerhamomyces ciferrii]|uniref:Mitochondrial intermediate peptidase n=1 Tax=Wickerhamomyces ciferrii (strain ATCC 14091 / BCRC 22168 / CBS 111 / JCM 3599 / NBRC 0793 / NRRL Y-1031 F-60-10) TaxID=1206466 RepID=K0KIB4_WICCF|nr:mitochondrial intermediate peptidase [Wickerhamomyces ciferrii]CCH41139.1 mitochondrial intermediate peptidase [Wickerhamomyces ciferrii]
MNFTRLLRSSSVLKGSSVRLRTFATSKPYLNQATSAAERKSIIPNHSSNTSLNYEIDPESPINNNNDLIQKVFDDDLFWNKFNKQDKATVGANIPFLNRFSKNSGLFQNPYLTSPSGLKEFSKDSLIKAKELVYKMTNDQSPEALRNYITNLDRLSDVLCRVIDLAEFIRVVHPKKAFINAAQEAHEEMFEFMNVLNTDVDLYLILKKVLTDESIVKHLSHEEVQVGQILLADFEKSGINMDPDTRNDFIEYSQQIAIYGQHFTNGLGETDKDYIEIPTEKLSGLDKTITSHLTTDLRRTNYKVPSWGYLPHVILRYCKDEDVRKKIWVELHSTTTNQVQLLETMLKYRGVLARIMHKPNFSAYQLDEKMAKSPEHVMNFLNKLAEETKPHAIQELRLLSNLKQKELGDTRSLTNTEVADYLKPWDRDYYSHLYSTNQRSSASEQISSYFSLGVVLQGLSNLFNSIYGIQLIPSQVQSGEIWSDDVRRLNVIDSKEGLVGIVYCDLFQRKGKTPNPAHFTVCCSRKIYSDEDAEDLKLVQTGKSKITGEEFQLPVISLVCNFEKNPSIGRCLLSLNDVETIFHEMGHAMHSMLGRTSLHNISGTRCATDFVELPSVLMEHFAKDPRVIQTFSRHYLTDEPIPLQLLETFQNENNYLKHTESYSQIKMALLDQYLHSNVVLSKTFNSTDIYHELEQELQILADPESNWQGRFGHLFGYGASYYSYLLDRAIASKVWLHLFASNPLDRTKGEKFKNAVLKWGGARNPWVCVADALNMPEVSSGDAKAMELIGETELKI